MDNSKLIVSRVLQVHEPSATRLGLDRLEEHRLILAFGRWAEGQIIEGSLISPDFSATCPEQCNFPGCRCQ